MLINTLGCTELPTERSPVIDHDTELTRGSVPARYTVADTHTIIVRGNGAGAVNGEAGKLSCVVYFLVIVELISLTNRRASASDNEANSSRMVVNWLSSKVFP